MNRKSLIFIALTLVIVSFLFVSCTTTKATQSQSANIEHYRFAAVKDIMEYNGGGYIIGDADVRIYDAINNTKIKMVGEKELQKLTEEEQKDSLLIKYSAYTTIAPSATVTVTFIDYLTEKPIISFASSHIGVFSIDNCVEKAFDKVITQMKQSFI